MSITTRIGQLVNYTSDDDMGGDERASTSKSGSEASSRKRRAADADLVPGSSSKPVNGSHNGTPAPGSLSSPSAKKLKLDTRQTPRSPNGSTKSNKLKSSKSNGSAESPIGPKARAQIAHRLSVQTAELPVNKAADYLVKAIMAQDTTIIMAETGSGKSTQIPQLLQKHRFAVDRYTKGSNDDKQSRTPSIAITQPRRLPCVSLATRVAEEMGVQLGKEVGYAVRFESKETVSGSKRLPVGVVDMNGSKDGAEEAECTMAKVKERKGETKLRYCTEGVLLREISMGRGMVNSIPAAGRSNESSLTDMDIDVDSLPGSTSRQASSTTTSTATTPTTPSHPSSPTINPTPSLSFYPNLPLSLLLRYDIVIVDEAHERTLNTDFLLGTLKQVQAARKELTRRLKEARARSASAEEVERHINGNSAESGGLSAFDSLAAQGDKMDAELANGHMHGNAVVGNGLLDTPDTAGIEDQLKAEEKQAREDEEIIRADWGGWQMRELKLVIMSATLQADLFSDYFDGAPICRVKGRSYHVAIKHMFQTPTDMDTIELALKQCLQIHVREEAGDILVFLPGQEDIEKLISGLKAAQADFPMGVHDILPLPLYRLMGQEVQNKVFQPAPVNTRKIIVSTNIAETGLTIDGIKYVVDAGTQKQKMVVLDRNLRMDALITAPCSQSAARQRSGRAGRTANGTCYRLYTEEQYRKRPMMTTPEIANANLASALLQLISITARPMEFPFLENPEADALSDAIRVLFFLQAVEIQPSGAFALTTKGKRMLRYPIAPESAATLIESFELGSTSEILTILAIREAGSPIADSPATRDAAAEKRKAFASREGDHLTYLKIYTAFDELLAAVQESKASGGTEAGRRVGVESPMVWAKEHGLSLKNLREARKIRAQLSALVKSEGENPDQSAGEDTTKVMLAVLRGMSRNAAQLDGTGQAYRPYAGGSAIKIHPSSVIHGKKSLAIVYDELRLTSGTYAHCVSAIEPSWLDDLNTYSHNRMQPLLNNGVGTREDEA